MKLEFDKNTTEFLKIIAKNALENNTRVFFVGGFVRDYLLNKKTLDIDFLIQGNAIEFVKTLPFEIVSLHKDFCSAKVQYKGNIIDFASTRTEFYPNSACLPKLKKIGVDLLEDVKRRDYTINSLYLEIKLKNNNLDFDLIDLVEGVNDIKNKTLRSLHNKSYVDDPTRILRGLDFKHRFDFEFSSNDKKLIEEYLSDINLENASTDRIFAVYKKILSKNNSFELFKELIEKKYYRILFKELSNVDYSRIIEIFKLINLNNNQKGLFYLEILKNEEKTKVKFDNLRDIIKYYKKLDIYQIAYYYYKTNDRNVLFYLDNKDLKINLSGKELLNLGYCSGRIIGEILDLLLEEKLKNPKNFLGIDSEINFVKEKFNIT